MNKIWKSVKRSWKRGLGALSSQERKALVKMVHSAKVAGLIREGERVPVKEIAERLNNVGL